MFIYNIYIQVIITVVYNHYNYTNNFAYSIPSLVATKSFGFVCAQ